MSAFTSKLERFRGRRVLVVGLGRSGIAAARVLAPVAQQVRACDAGSLAALGSDAAALETLGVTLYSTCQDTSLLEGMDLVVRSPGVPFDVPLIQAARAADKEVIGELELAYRLLPTDRLVAVTGTNGKSTTTALIGEMFQRAGDSTVVAGNIGVALTSVVADIGAAATVVVEVSSFQLEDATELKPKVGIILNLAPDHLDRHGSAAEYYRLKWRLFENQGPSDYAVLNAEDDLVFGERDRLDAEVLTFGGKGGRNPGVWVEDGYVKYDVRGRRGILLAATEIVLPGPHNLLNAMAAAAAVLALNAPASAIVSTLRAFKGLPHRLEDAGVVNGVRYINDSKATNVASAITALNSFANPIVLIAGGKGKGEDFAPLARAAQGKARAAVLYGAARSELEKAFSNLVRNEVVETVADAVAAAARIARPGDVVLLAPACTSWDQYNDFEERGEDFKRRVRALAEEGTE